MYLPNFNIKIPTLISLLFIVACGKKTQISPLQNDDIDLHPTPIPDTKSDPTSKHPAMELNITAPEKILYVSTVEDAQHANGIKSVVFEAHGSGGLGAHFTDEDYLVPYEGIPFKLTKKDMLDSDIIDINVRASGDQICSNLFHYKSPYDKQRPFLTIDSSLVKTYVSCNVTVKALATSSGNLIQSEKSFPVILNLTLKDYAKNDDPGVKYLYNSYSSDEFDKKNLDQFVQWLKEDKQLEELNLGYNAEDPKKNTKGQLENLNFLTGDSNLTSLDVSNTNIKDLRALVHLKKLKHLNLSGTRIDSQDLAVLASLAKLKSLSLKNLNLKNIEIITNSVSQLTELDISNNPQIKNLENIKNIKNLKILNMSNIGITHIKELESIVPLINLDISNNDLSTLNSDDLNLLSNLINLSSLNVSNSKIKDEFLESFFARIDRRNSLTAFYDRNDFSNECNNINKFDQIPSLALLKKLQKIDIHGNKCYASDNAIGLTNTNLFSNLKDLNYIDISNTAVENLDGLAQLKKLETLILHSEGGNISLTKEACENQLKTASASVKYECTYLGVGQARKQEFTAFGPISWVVPKNVYRIHVKGCSGGDGGSGGQGGQGGVTTGKYLYYPAVPPSCIERCTGGQPERWEGAIRNYPDYVPSKYDEQTHIGYGYISLGSLGEVGQKGEDGGITSLSRYTVDGRSLENEFFTTQNGREYSSEKVCEGGSEGSGGAAGETALGDWGDQGFPHAVRGTNGVKGKTKMFSEMDLEVNPGDMLNITIGNGGRGGNGGNGAPFKGCAPQQAGSRIDNNKIHCSWPGANGGSGGNGSNGYLSVTYNQ